jgi:hypothetical protein
MRTYYLIAGAVFVLCSAFSLAGSPGKDAPEKSRAEISAIAADIDRLVEQKLRSVGLQPNPPASDATFLRRIYLDIAGRIPTLDEAKSFLSSTEIDKREKLIDQLLASDGYVSHHFHFWADLLRVKNRLNRQVPGQPYIEFVKQSLRDNTPYDEVVRELLVSSGPLLSNGNGAVGYYLRDFQMPEDHMANTVRVFLGTRIECAQCHDHPFDRWTQREFYEMVAFTGGVRMRVQSPLSAGRGELMREIQSRDLSPELRQAVLRLNRTLSLGVEGSGTGLARLPDIFQSDDGEPNEIVTAKTMFEHDPLVEVSAPRRSHFPPLRKKRFQQAQRIPGARDVDSRTAFADWLTSPNNPRFTLVIANRLWKKAMGAGLIEPVDDIHDTGASNPELMDYLTQQMVALDYDMKQFLRAIYYSRTYQRESSPYDSDSLAMYHFPGPVLRRMTAEQAWDSLLTLVVPDLDHRAGIGDAAHAVWGGPNLYATFEQLRGGTADDLIQAAQAQLRLRRNPQERRRLMQAMMISEIEDVPSEGSELRRQMRDLQLELRQARDERDRQKLQKLMAQRREIWRKLQRSPARRAANLVRASELTSPARPGHFLRVFGQSDREQIDNASIEPSVTQALALMNGFVEQQIVANPRTVLMNSVAQSNDLREKIDTVCLSMLSRHPTEEEFITWVGDAETDGPEAVNDLIWSLANSCEFLFIQ